MLAEGTRQVQTRLSLIAALDADHGLAPEVVPSWREVTNDDDDDEVFALGSAFAGDLAAMAGGEHARLGIEADRKRRFESKLEAWARRRGLTENGKIELRLDSPRLSGGHLRRAIDVVAAMARARVSTAPYR